jgi:hypothetical protein
MSPNLGTAVGRVLLCNTVGRLLAEAVVPELRRARVELSEWDGSGLADDFDEILNPRTAARWGPRSGGASL